MNPQYRVLTFRFSTTIHYQLKTLFRLRFWFGKIGEKRYFALIFVGATKLWITLWFMLLVYYKFNIQGANHICPK